MACLHFSQFLQNFIFPKFMGNTLTYIWWVFEDLEETEILLYIYIYIYVFLHQALQALFRCSTVLEEIIYINYDNEAKEWVQKRDITNVLLVDNNISNIDDGN